MKIVLIAKPGHADSGVGRYVDNLAPALQTLGLDVVIVYPIVPMPYWFLDMFQKFLHWDLRSFFLTYPVWISYPRADLYHFTSQNLATLMIFRPPPGKSLITVHDIIPWDVRNDPDLRQYRHCLHKFFDRLALSGIIRFNKIITDSDYSARSLKKALSDGKSEIQIIYLAP